MSRKKEEITQEMASEVTQDMTKEEMAALQEKVSHMTPEEFTAFQNSIAPDSMGFLEEEAPTYED